MKKASITILLVLPIILIYFISVLGKIVSKYSRIAAEAIEVTLLNEKLEDDQNLTFFYEDYGSEPIDIEIDVLPEFTNDRTYTITSSHQDVANIVLNEAQEPKLYLYNCGEERASTKITITSNDNVAIEFKFNITVAFGQLQELFIYDADKGISNRLEEVYIPVGKTKSLALDFSPTTTLAKYKNCFWGVEDSSIISIKQNNNKMAVTALKEGQTTLTATSIEMPSIKKEIVVNVGTSSREDAYFNHFENKSFAISQNEFDLKVKGGETNTAGKIIIQNDELTYDDLVVECVSGMDSINLERLENEKVLEFLVSGKTADLNLYRKVNDKEIFLDKIRIKFSGR